MAESVTARDSEDTPPLALTGSDCRRHRERSAAREKHGLGHP